MPKYIDFFTDFGFKRLFGEELNKDILIDFLNSLLKKEDLFIKDLTYIPNEQMGRAIDDRRAIFDLYCENEKGEKFIIEMQKTHHLYFKERMVYYSTFPIQKQAEEGVQWKFDVKAVYCIGILDFKFNDDEKYYTEIKLLDTATHKIFYDKLTYIFLEMPKFDKSIEQLDNRFDKWMFVIKNLEKFDNIPKELKEEIFLKFFQIAEISKFTHTEYDTYRQSLKYYIDFQLSLDYAELKGKDEGMQIGIEIGIEQGIEKVAINMLKNSTDFEIIAKNTGISIDKIRSLYNELNKK
jgi:predicted transposase/invertase (TIGR01784 family)